MLTFLWAVVSNIALLFIVFGLVLLAKSYKLILFNWYMNNKDSISEENLNYLNLILKSNNSPVTDDEKAVFNACKIFEYALYFLAILVFLIILF